MLNLYVTAGNRTWTILHIIQAHHPTIDCTRKEKSKDVKCVLCEGNHPANYKGCTVYKDLQNKTFPPLRKKTPASFSKLPSVITPGISYAKIVNQGREENVNEIQGNLQSQHQSNDMTELKSIVKMLLEQISTMFTVLNTVLSKMS